VEGVATHEELPFHQYFEKARKTARGSAEARFFDRKLAELSGG
jgi:hypothetical protein